MKWLRSCLVTCLSIGALYAQDTTREDRVLLPPITSIIEARARERGRPWQHHAWDLLGYAFIDGIYDRQHACARSCDKFFSANEFLFDARRQLGNGLFDILTLVSLEPGTIGNCGYPLLFSTAGTANCITPLIDRYPPRELLSELALCYVYPVRTGSIYGYLAYPGDAGIGPLPEQLLTSYYIPDGSLAAPWLTTTQTSYGVIRAGAQWRNVRIEAAGFNGRLPESDHWKPNRPRINSFGTRLALFPTPEIIGQISWGYIKSPDVLECGIDNNRVTASLSYTRTTDLSQWQTVGAGGVTIPTCGDTSYGILIQSSYNYQDRHIVFGRFERIAREDLIPRERVEPELSEDEREDFQELERPHRPVYKFLAGYRYQLPVYHHMLWSAGFSVSGYKIDKALERLYGNRPFSYFLFLRVELL